jgi:hypothetical protein
MNVEVRGEPQRIFAQMTFNLAQGARLLTAELSIFEDTTSEPVSTLDALNDIAGTVDAIVLSLAAGRAASHFHKSFTLPSHHDWLCAGRRTKR